jgi:pyrimidine operon attenuation protein / uracil phosphoribosyltransferase
MHGGKCRKVVRRGKDHHQTITLCDQRNSIAYFSPTKSKAMTTTRTHVLNATQVAQKIDRIAFEIYEQHYSEQELIIGGIAGNGFRLAQLIADRLGVISEFKLTLVEVQVNKQDPLAAAAYVELEKDDVRDRVVILVDDVLNSGKTLIYGVRHFLQVPMKALHTAVLIDRDHKRFPILADHVGLTLSTTLQEHVTVILDGEMGVYLD